MFDQQPNNLIKPKPKPKPTVPVPSNGNVNHGDHVANGVHSTGPHTKRFTPPPGSFTPGIPHSIGELSQVKLKKAPPPKPPASSNDSSNELPFSRRPSLNKPKPIAPKPVPGVKPVAKPKPAVSPRKPLSSTSGQVHSPPLSPTPSSSAKSDADDSTSISSSFSDSSSLPRTSTTESNTSRTESSASRRSGKPEMQILPSPEVLGSAPPKPKKPMIRVVLPSPTRNYVSYILLFLCKFIKHSVIRKFS